MESFGDEYIPIEIKNFIGNKNITRNICRIQANDSLMYEYFYVKFIGFVQTYDSIIIIINDTN